MGVGQLVAPHKVKATAADGKSKEFTAEHVIIAVGAKPVELPFAKFDGKQIVLFGKGRGDEKQRYESKTVTILEDNGNKIVHKQFSVGPDGQDRLVMERIMTKKPK